MIQDLRFAFTIWDLGLLIQDLGFIMMSVGCEIVGWRFWLQSIGFYKLGCRAGCEVSSSGFRVLGMGYRVLGLRVQGLEHRVQG